MQHLVNQIHNINCFEVLKQLPDNSIDLVLTDPPYLTTNLEYDKLAAKTLDFNKWYSEILRVAKPNAPILIFSSGKFTYNMVRLGWKQFRYELIWDKVNKVTGSLSANSRPLLNHELVLYFSKTFARRSIRNPRVICNPYNHGVLAIRGKATMGRAISLYGKTRKVEYKKLNDKQYPRSILRFNKPSVKGIHPSEKPYPLIEYLIRLYSNPEALVLDTFSGSGVVANACLANNRQFIATELDSKFYQASIERIENYKKTNECKDETPTNT